MTADSIATSFLIVLILVALVFAVHHWSMFVEELCLYWFFVETAKSWNKETTAQAITKVNSLVGHSTYMVVGVLAVAILMWVLSTLPTG